MSSSSEVEILLATYNGDRFLREQIDSILMQDYADIRILARDDGSTDRTLEILSEYVARFPDRFRLLPSMPPTGGAKNNFLRLMEASTADRICFCDQDDVWSPDKVSRTKQEMDILASRWGIDVPLLVFTDLRVVDENLNILHGSLWAKMNIDPGCMANFARLLVQSVVTGCTAMINRRLLELSLRMPEQASMHDRWIGLLVSGMGKYSFVKTPTVLYRQHGRNVIGTGTAPQARSLLERFLHPRMAQKHFIQWKNSQEQAAAFLKLYAAELPPGKRDLIMAYLRCGTSKSRLIRIATLIRYGFYYPGILSNLLSVFNLWNVKLDKHGAG